MITPTNLFNPRTTTLSRTNLRLFRNELLTSCFFFTLLLHSTCRSGRGIFGVCEILLILCASAAFVPGRGADDAGANRAGYTTEDWFCRAERVQLA